MANEIEKGESNRYLPPIYVEPSKPRYGRCVQCWGFGKGSITYDGVTEEYDCGRCDGRGKTVVGTYRRPTK